MDGKYRKDPLCMRVTLCYKDADQLAKGTHVASHGYVKSKTDLSFVRAPHAGEKPDLTPKGDCGVVWPSDDELTEAPEIGYGHLPGDDEE